MLAKTSPIFKIPYW